MTFPPRAQPTPVMFSTTRLAVRARTAPPSWSFTVWLSAEQMQAFETWYRDIVEHHEGEFYAPWIGQDRVVAFGNAYQLLPLGKGWALNASVFRTRIDHTICEGIITAVFGNLYQAVITAADIYQADLAAADVYQSTFALSLIAANEC